MQQLVSFYKMYNIIDLHSMFILFLINCLEGDPSNYLTYYKRGTVYFALGKAKFAITDFSKVLDLKPDFIAAKLQRANVNMKLGLLTEAAGDYYDVVSVKCLF